MWLYSVIKKIAYYFQNALPQWSQAKLQTIELFLFLTVSTHAEDSLKKPPHI